MHIPDGVLNPQVCAAAAMVSLAAVGYSVRKLENKVTDRVVPLTGMLAAFVFAGQMVNFPLPGAMVSGHLMGGVLAATILGPWAGCLALTLVLIVQCVLFADGGQLALGANVLHMAVVGSLGGYAVFSCIRRMFRDDGRGILVGSMVAAWLSVMAAACLFSVEFLISHYGSDFEMSRVLTLMVTWHSAIGVGEALITGIVVGFVLQQRPDLFQARTGSSFRSIVPAGILVAVALAAFAAPFASSHPDGLEAVAESAEFSQLATESPSLWLEDYFVPLNWTGNTAEKASVAIAGIVGTLAVLFLSVVMSRAMRPRVIPAEARRE